MTRSSDSESVSVIPTTLVVMAMLVGMVVAAYWPALDGEFLFDDRFEIVNNPALAVLWPPTTAMFTGGSQPHRPIPYYTLAINYACGGLDPRGYHIFNLVIHLINGAVGWWVVRETLRRLSAVGRLPALDPPAVDAVAFATAAVWLAHPLCTQAVSYVYQRMESLATLSLLGGFACFLQFQAAPRSASRACWMAATVSCAALGVLCKEHAAVAPLCLALFALVLRPASEPLTLRTAANALLENKWLVIGLSLIWPLAGWVVWAQRARYSEFGQARWTLWEYVLSQPRSLTRYLQLAVWPAGQSIDYCWVPPVGFWEQAPGWVITSLWVGLFLWGLKYAPAWALASGIPLLVLAPTSSLLPVGDLCVEHRMYLPLLPLVAAVMVGGAAAIEKLLSGKGFSGLVRSRIVRAGGVGIALLLAVITWHRNHAYRTEREIWEAVWAADQGHQRAAMILAGMAGAEGDFGRVEQLGRAALKGKRQFVEFQARLLTQLAVAIDQNGGSLDEAIACARHAGRLAPTIPEIHGVLGDLLAKVNPVEAAAAYRRAANASAPD